jgi:Arc/MetJ-type ribon-helix-helix transcriptional regulator
MNISDLELTPAQRQALVAQPEAPVYIADQQTRKIYMLVEKGRFPELEDEYIREGLELAREQIARGETSKATLDKDYIRDRLEEGYAAIERGEVEDWDSASIKAEGRETLRRNQSPS